MTTSREDMVTNVKMFAQLVDRALNGTPAGMGWGTYEDIICPRCYHTDIYYALVGTKGWTCKHCGLHYSDMEWRSDILYDEGSTLWPVGWVYAEMNWN